MKVGVIGTGNMGENHVRTYLSMQEHCQLIGVFDNDPEKGRQISDKYQVKQFQSLPNLLQAVDAVSIAVPTEFHYDIGLLCMDHKVHILMEKPITDTVPQAKELTLKAEEAGIKLQVGHIELFNPLINMIRKELEHEKIIGMDFHRMSPYHEKIKNVDVVKDLMIHDLYILQEILQDDELLDFYTMGKIIENTPKHASVITRSAEGVIGKLTASFKSKRKVRTIQILTENAFIEADILKNEINVTRDTITQTIQITSDEQPLEIQLTDFLNCIKSDLTPSVSGKAGIAALKTTNEISRAIMEDQI
ncbi:Gfo/Idh/MocA family oxidoreductase [Radiobacillus kanasensis]|uniref:Gfo/Idh/MocA family protein n=1 Tax=Radiobacillus kanasensis TaxID=2844358 RepID=UPI001E4D067D|nr:Gfo/Idh/MocA family oxidoreductase [Radiobacillus kanasensis]UFU00034.1 Gfo/Idh/MocA family oxidoreductase [Radiobacillus kanasensis]